MPDRGDLVTFVNRAPVPLDFVFNGTSRTLQPGDNPNLPWEWSPYAKNQNPIMGEENPHTMTGASLVGVRESSKDDCTPLTKTQWAHHLKSVERWNRGKYGSPIWGEQTKAPKILKRSGVNRADVGYPTMGGEVTFRGAD